jgi:hypothetical protein
MSLRNSLLFSLVILSALFLHGAVLAQKPVPSSVIIPDGLGYNIHFTDAKPGEMEQLAASGAKIVRMDFGWGGTEREKGIYDFSAFDRLTDTLEKHKIRPVYILDYSNRHYDDGQSPRSEEGRKAFARWAAAAAVHFKDRGIIWEMYNEPNIQFWKPEPKVEDYIKLALEVGKALREAAPNEIYIGPGTAQNPTLHTIDFQFIEECFKAGLLNYWDAVSVHPYRQTNPETVFAEYAKLRALIDQYAPKGVIIPIISGEWGYSSAWQNFNDEIQGKYLPRQWMINLAFKVPVSIWYDWHDDGADAEEAEHHFGTVNYDYYADKTPVYEPKPSYIAAKTFIETFRGYRYNKRLMTSSGDDVFVFVFGKENKEMKLAVWTTAKEPKQIKLPCPEGTFDAVSYLGEKLPEYDSRNSLSVSDCPIYLTPKTLDQTWVHTVLSEPSLPIAVYGSDLGLAIESSDIPLINPFAAKPQQVTVKGTNYRQKTDRYNPHPTTVSLPIPVKNALLVTIKHPKQQTLKGKLRLAGVGNLKIKNRMVLPDPFSFAADTETLRIPLESMPKGKYQFELSGVVEETNSPDVTFPIYPRYTMQLLDDISSRTAQTLHAAWEIHPDGDKEVKSEQSIAVADDGALRITYQFSEGWKFIRLAPKGAIRQLGEGNDIPKTLGLLLRGDGSGNSVNIRFTDSKGQTFQVRGGVLRDKEPYYFECALDGTKASHWGGPNDGKVHYPITFDCMIIDGTRKACGPLSVDVYSPVVIY